MPQYLTADDLIARWNGVYCKGTIANWRTKNRRRGPPFTKIGGKVLYPVDQLEEWEAKNTHNKKEQEKCKN